jgi:hypothetical protein
VTTVREEINTAGFGLQESAATGANERRTSSQLWRIAFRQRSVWSRGAKLGLSVGVLQAILNQGDVWLAHDETLGTVIKTIISPLVTFSVALVSAAATYVEKLKLNS